MSLSRLRVLFVLFGISAIFCGCGGFNGVLTPTLSAINPASIAAGSPAFTLTATGTNFASGTQILWNGVAQPTTVVSSTQLTTSISAQQVAVTGTVTIRVMKADTTTSGAIQFTITGSGSGGGSGATPPTLTSLNPNTAYNGSPAITLTANGTNFVNGSQVVWDGTALPTTFVSSTVLTANVAATYLTTAAVANVFVLNPDSTVSNELPFTIAVSPSTVPTLTSISPTKMAVGSPAFTLTLNGMNFAPGAVAYFGTDALPTTVMSATQLTAQVPASDLTAVAEVAVTAKNAKSGPSNPIPFLVGMTIFFGEVNDLAWDPARNIMYISQPDSSSSTTVKNPDTVMAIDPDTLVAEWTYTAPAGSNPDRLALSADHKYLYVGMDGLGTVQRLILGNQTYVPDITISLGSDSNLGPYYAMDLQVDPLQSNTIAVARGIPASVSIVQAQGGVAVYDGTTQRPSVVTPTTQSGDVLLDTIQWGANDTTLYAANSENYEADFYQLAVSSGGVTLTSDHPNSLPIPNLRIHFDSTNQLLYADDGIVLNPVTAAQSGNFVSSGAMTPDSTIGNAYFVGQSSSQVQTVAYTVQSFNITTLSPVAELPLYQVEGVPQHLIRWGSSGLAFTTKRVENCVVSPCTIGDGRLYVIDGPFVTQTAP